MGLIRQAVSYRYGSLYQMVKYLSILLISLSLNNGWASSTINEGLIHFNMIEDTDEQIEYLKTLGVKLDKSVIQYLTSQLSEEEKIVFIKKLLEPFTPEQRQELIYALLSTSDYNSLLDDLPLCKYEEVGDLAFPSYFVGSTIIDWLNAANFPSFFEPIQKSALINRSYFNKFNTFDQIGIFLEPYGYSTSLDLSTTAHQFDLYTVGLSIGGSYTIYERLVFCLGLGYSHSEINWKEVADQSSLNTLYFGPSLSYLFTYGYISTMIFGMANFYHADRETNLFPTLIEKEIVASGDFFSWDITTRLEGGLSFPIGTDYYLSPNLRLDYSAIFIQSHTEMLDETIGLNIDSLSKRCLRLKATLKFTREVFVDKFGFIILALSGGWLNNIPITNNSLSYELDNCDGSFTRNASINSWSQMTFGVGISLLHKRGVFASLDYEYDIDKKSPTHIGAVRVGLTW